MKRYKKRPVIIEAVQWTGENLIEVTRFTGQKVNLDSEIIMAQWEKYTDLVASDGLKIHTLEGSMLADIGDFIIKGVKDECYPCKPDIFSLTYEEVGDE